MRILLVAEHDNVDLKSSNRHSVSAANQLGAEIDMLVVGYQCEGVANQACLLPSLRRVLHVDHKVYEHRLPENLAVLVAQVGNDYDYLLLAATTFGKNLLPRVAALLDVGMSSDITQILNSDTFLRPIYAGNIISRVQSSDKIKLLTIRTTAFAAVANQPKPVCAVEKLFIVIPNHSSRFESQSLTLSERPELTSAKVVVAGGRGLRNAENFKLIEKLADQLGAAVGASRAAVDAGFISNDYQVGQTGKIVAPDLYIAVGISGAIQHLAGMKDSKVIVAINNDPDAPIFEEADYILKGDLFEILPKLTEELMKLDLGKIEQR